ncbi:MAG: hypothetical protein JRD69_09880, partial [Deltaproteobacteria bacterium]|nr:hypothetical protein [Deltaproteobacteria bacterium]
MIALDISVGDIHVGNKFALMYPDADLDYRINASQRWLFKAWSEHFLPAVETLIDGTEFDHVHLLLGGDLGDKDGKNRSTFFWSRDEKTIVENAVTLLEPLVDMVDSVHVIRGTQSHTGPASSIDEAIARNFDNVVWKSKRDKQAAWYKTRYKLAGVLVDAQHYGKNKSKWADENLITALRTEVIKEYAGEELPKMIQRFHFHWFGTTSIHKEPIVMQCPSWQLPNEYIAEIDAVGRKPVVGGV